MVEFDDFCRHLLEQAKRFYEKAAESTDTEAKSAFLNAALYLGFCAFEAHLNGVAEDICMRSNCGTLEKAMLLEKDIRFKDGEFKIDDRLRISRLEDRVLCIHQLCGHVVDKSSGWWPLLQGGLDLRNKLTHPKEKLTLSEQAIERALEGIIGGIDSLYLAAFNKSYPAIGRGLQSRLTF